MDPAKELKRHDLRAFVEDRFAPRPQGRSRPRCTARPTRPPAGCRRRREAFKIDAEWAKYQRPVRRQRVRPRLPAGPQAGRVGRAVRRGRPERATTRTPTTSRATRASSRRWSTPGPACSTDLKERGLLDNTLVVWMGEIGRTPQHQQPRRPRPLRPLLDHGPGRLRHQGRAGLRRDATRTASR